LRQTLYQKTQQRVNHAPTAILSAEYSPELNMPEILWLTNSAANVTQPKSAENHFLKLANGSCFTVQFFNSIKLQILLLVSDPILIVKSQ